MMMMMMMMMIMMMMMEVKKLEHSVMISTYLERQIEKKVHELNVHSVLL